ncbi:MAG: hypothetical protein ACPLKX_00690 [Dictyoglomaceae bacterium]
MSLWWIKELELRLKSRKYIRIEITLFLFLILLLVIFWPDTILNLKTFTIPNLSLFFFTLQGLVFLYLSSLIASGNLLAEREFKIFDLAKYAPTNLWDIVLGKFLSIFLYILFLLILLLPLNILVNFVSSPYQIRIHYFITLMLLDTILFVSLGILWSTIYNPTLNWTAHWLTFLMFIFLPFIFPFLSPFLPLNNILWIGMAQRLLSLDIIFSPLHFLIILISYIFLSFLFLFISQKRLKSWRKNE